MQVQADGMGHALVFINHVHWLWTTSALVAGGKGFVFTTRRILFVARALTIYGSIKPIISAPPGSPLGKLIARRPETVGSVTWHYQCAGWNAQTRLARIRDHYATIEEIGGPIDFPLDANLKLLDLAEIREGLSLIVDQPKWLMREGQLTINLFLGEIRIYSLVFSLFHHGDGIAAFVGCIQGRDIGGILPLYRELTKASHGMRPRDLLIDAFRMLCKELGVTQIFAVADEYRYSDIKSKSWNFSSYNEIWADRGGTRVHPMFFQLDLEVRKRDLAIIAAKKRGMYKRRYEMLERIRQHMHDNLVHLASHKRMEAISAAATTGRPKTSKNSREDMFAARPAAKGRKSLVSMFDDWRRALRQKASTTPNSAG
jgi:uncharacterized protein